MEPTVAEPTGGKLERALERWFGADGRRSVGQVAVLPGPGGRYALCHRDDRARTDLTSRDDPEEAVELAKYDDQGVYRPLKTAPNLRRGWRLELRDAAALRRALEGFYPGRLGAFLAWEEGRFEPTSLRATLRRQTGMYRVTQKLTDEQADALVGSCCRSDGGCLRTLRWTREDGADPGTAGPGGSSQLPAAKADPEVDQTGQGEPTVPLLCEEACNLLVAAARTVVKKGAA